MKTISRYLIAAMLGGLISAVTCDAQDGHGHTDIEFLYEDGRIAVEFGSEGPVFEGKFPTEGVDLQFTSEPGFASDVTEGMGIGSGHQVAYDVLSDLMFWNGEFQSIPNNSQIRIINRPPSPIVPDSLIGAATGIQPGGFSPARNRIGEAAADGDFHSDLQFLLEPKGDTANESMIGAYGFIVSLRSDASDIAPSDPFAIVLNYGLEEAVFEDGVGAFAQLVPEPSGLAGLLCGTLCLASRLRRKM